LAVKVPTVTLRFFAAARAAAGASEAEVRLSSPFTVHEAIDAANPGTADYDSLMTRCSLLLNAVAETNRDRILADGDILDVLPPFAGG
jgi:molybdopterin converting factor small subunit